MTENELMVAKEEMLRKIAKRLGQGEPPCNYYRFMDEVAEFCDEQYCSDLCDTTECWHKVLEKIVGEQNDNDKP